MQPLGTITRKPEKNQWEITATPDIIIELKRILPKANQTLPGRIVLQNNPETCDTLRWIALRFPLAIPEKRLLNEESKKHRRHLQNMEELISRVLPCKGYEMALPPRPYQATAAELTYAQKFLLLADQMGTGKTISAIALLSKPGTRPAAIVCQAHLCRQWKNFLERFLPQANTEIAKTSKPHALKGNTEIIILSYNKLKGWVDHLAGWGIQTVVYDEVQELRRPESQKYRAANILRNAVKITLGTSGTPVINFGGEIFHIYEIIAPGRLGTESEFKREWCSVRNQKWIVNDPQALGACLRRQHLMLRRTRHDIRAQLPELTTSTQPIPFKPDVLHSAETAATELARIILEGSFHEQGQAARELDLKLRQCTGIAKAPYVAEFVRLLVEDGSPVLLAGWHRAVYDIWMENLKDLNPLLYTGSESPAQKEASKEKFLSGESNILIISLRSGAGLDGLQHRCSTVVYGELDWSRGIHEQVTARVHRDGQQDPVSAIYLMADGGSDPIVAQILGIKAAQADGILDPFQTQKLPAETDLTHIKLLAKHILAKHKNQAT